MGGDRLSLIIKDIVSQTKNIRRLSQVTMVSTMACHAVQCAVMAVLLFVLSQ